MAGTVAIPGPPRATMRSLVDAPLVRFMCVGIGSTGLHLGLFAALVPALPMSQLANLVALVVATVANTAINRRWTFGVRDARTAARHHLQALLLFALTWAASAGALWLLHSLATRPPVLVQTLVVGASMAVSTLVRYVGMRTWIFAPTDAGMPPALVSGRHTGWLARRRDEGARPRKSTSEPTG